MPWNEFHLGGSPAAEAEIFRQFARDIAGIQKLNRKASQAARIKRGFHAKRHIATHQAEFTVNATIPTNLTGGLFQPGKRYRATVRFSNAAGLVQSDRKMDERGIAVRLWDGDIVIQDLLMSNSPVSHARDAIQFMEFGLAIAKRGALGAFALFPRLGLPEGVRILSVLVRRTSRPVTSLAFEQFWSRTPYALGKTALKFSLVPLQTGELAPIPRTDNYLREDLILRLQGGALNYSFRVQEWKDNINTPIEDGSVVWKEDVSPFTELGQLSISRQVMNTPEAQATADQIDRLTFSPWSVTTSFRPLGSLNRARRPVYRSSAESRRERLSLTQAENPKTTPFDYIVVGSGAGGGPLAARLARAGKTVLLIEAGKDPAWTPPAAAYPTTKPGEVHDIPGYYAAATEDPEMSWMFSVRHYDDDTRQALDAKYNAVPIDPNSPVGMPRPLDAKYLDPPSPKSPGKRGVFYPRSSCLGGCTGHHAMIVVAPNDRDWNYIADLTGDPSWQAEHMQKYFTKLERCLYLDEFELLPPLQKSIRRLFSFFGACQASVESGHGSKGWQPTSHISMGLVLSIFENDRDLIKLLLKSVLSVFHRKPKWWEALKREFLHYRNLRQLDLPLDFNDLQVRRSDPEGVFPIPLGTEDGRRIGVREFLLQTQEDYPANLVIASGLHVAKVLFQNTGVNTAPRAIGVECLVGDHLYAASPVQKPQVLPSKAYFCRREVILSGGSFNTPQILMLSGIGDAKHLEALKIPGLSGAKGQPLDQGRIIHLPGVGKNLQDRYEISVISRLDKELATLKGVSFRPCDLEDPARQQWMKNRTGLYATNGGILAIIRRSAALSANEREPDLFTFGVPAAFRGYYWNWSKELLRPIMGEPAEQRNLWSWVILKAYTANDAGTVRLRTTEPLDMPDICFNSFQAANGDVTGAQKDLKALLDSVDFVRGINADNPEQFVEELQPGEKFKGGSKEMEDWIKLQAWGHHACGTCRIGADAWRADVTQLQDQGAVLDSKFRVHGVEGLRVVDASVFPAIPGYFILAPIYMISEKAADAIINNPEDQGVE